MAAVAQMDRNESDLSRGCTRWPQSTPRSIALSVPPPIHVRPIRALTGAKRTIPMVHLHISDITPARYAQGALSILRAYVGCVGVPTASGACPVSGAIGPCRGVLPRPNARCVVDQ